MNKFGLGAQRRAVGTGGVFHPSVTTEAKKYGGSANLKPGEKDIDPETGASKTLGAHFKAGLKRGEDEVKAAFKKGKDVKKECRK